MPELFRFQSLRGKINEVMLNLLNDCLRPTNLMVKNLVTVQNAYINTYHPDFMGGANSIFSMFEPYEDLQNEKQKRLQIERIDDPQFNQEQSSRKDGIRS